MGLQTIITINHDRLPRPEDEARWAGDILHAIRTGWIRGLVAGELRALGALTEVAEGVHFVAQNHHTEELTIRFDGRSAEVRP